METSPGVNVMAESAINLPPPGTDRRTRLSYRRGLGILYLSNENSFFTIQFSKARRLCPDLAGFAFEQMFG